MGKKTIYAGPFGVMSWGEALVVVLVGTVLAGLVGFAIIYFRYHDIGEAAPKPAPAAPKPRPPSAPPTLERPTPTPEQSAALADGHEAIWKKQEVRWTVPKDWQAAGESDATFGCQSGTAAMSTVVSPLFSDDPFEYMLEAFYAQQDAKRQNGALVELRYLEIDGVKGVEWLEPPTGADGLQKLVWIGYRSRGGQKQTLGMTFMCKSADFAVDGPAFYAILYSTKIAHD